MSSYHPMVSEIQEAVCRYFGCQMVHLISPERHHRIAHPRQIGMYLAHELTRQSYPQIGERFGGRDHTTVIFAVKQVAKRRNQIPEVDQDVRRVRMLAIGAMIDRISDQAEAA